MKILVYGAGVLGCALAHELHQYHDVTLLARGQWKQMIDSQGLTIRHYIQRKTTVDQIKTIEVLNEDDQYDLIFVSMQSHQLISVLPIIARNISQKVIFIGNNGHALKIEQTINELSLVKKEIAFAFQTTGGRREHGKVVSIYKGLSLTIGGVQNSLSSSFQNDLEKAFQDTKYKMSYESNMNAWLQCHLAFILPICYVCYSVDGCLPKATRRQRKLIIDAINEGYQVLQKLNIPILPQGDEWYFQKGIKRKLMEAMIFVMMKTPIGRLAASDHAMNAVEEMWYLDQQFESLCQKANINMKCWKQLKNEMVPWEQLRK